MNNPNNSNRVVINLDGNLDDLDDDDITLPSLPTQSVPIIDDTEDTVVTKTPNNKSIPEQQVNDTSDQGIVNTDESNSIALGTPVGMTEGQSAPYNTFESFSDTKSDTQETNVAVNANVNAMPSIPAMPLQEQLGDTPSVAPMDNPPKAPELENPAVESQETQENKKSGSWFNRMKTGLSKSRKNLAEGMVSILIGGKEIDDELLEEVEDQLLVADIGVNATNRIIKSLTEQTARGDLIYAHSLYKALQSELVDILTPKVEPLVIDTSKKPFVILMVGVNGVGKTTTIGKLAKRLQGEGKSVMLAAGDTFRAAATEQLQI